METQRGWRPISSAWSGRRSSRFNSRGGIALLYWMIEAKQISGGDVEHQCGIPKPERRIAAGQIDKLARPCFAFLDEVADCQKCKQPAVAPDAAGNKAGIVAGKATALLGPIMGSPDDLFKIAR
jgi:hypothetical protein